MTKTYSVKSNCTRAARKAFPDGDFVVFKADDGDWAFRKKSEYDNLRQTEKKERHATMYGIGVKEFKKAVKGRFVGAERHESPAAAGVKLKVEDAMELDLHQTFRLAYDHFNLTLFDGRLPECMILVHRKKGARGYFWAERWKNRDNGEGRHEIAMNPDTFGLRTTEDILSTLVYEMTHLEQQVFGKSAKGGYHDKDWVKLMHAVGLMPYASTGPEPEIVNGVMQRPKKDTGTKVTHAIIPDGAFEVSCAELLATGVTIHWVAHKPSPADVALAKKKRASKTKFTCPSCQQNAWAKPDASIGCWTCDVEMEDEA